MSKSASRLSVYQISVTDRRGGSALVAWHLHRAYVERGIDSQMFVGRKFSGDARVTRLPNDERRGAWCRLLLQFAQGVAGHWKGRRGAGRVAALLELLADRERFSAIQRGLEDFEHPGSELLLEPATGTPDIYHCHNLQGGYFDLRLLPRLSAAAPLVATLHDSWLLSGHCSQSIGCGRWQTGCGACPDLTIYPAIRHDATAFNWKRKRALLRASRLYLAAPSQWLMDRVEQTLDGPGIADRRVIPNGVNVELFRPGGRDDARASLGLPADAVVMLSMSKPRNAFKDYGTLRSAVERLSPDSDGRRRLLVVLGRQGKEEFAGDTVIRFVPHVDDGETLRLYYVAADIYVHAAVEDTFPNSVLEALACGVPVVASAVGGIPEQIVDRERTGSRGAPTGVLVPPRDAEAMAAALQRVLADADHAGSLGRAAAADARRRFDLRQQVERYIDWYTEILDGTGTDSLRQTGS